MKEEIINMYDWGISIDFIINRIYSLLHHKYSLRNSQLTNDINLNSNCTKKDVHKVVIKIILKHLSDVSCKSYGTYLLN